MNAATAPAGSRDPFMPQPPKVRGRALALAALAHVLLFLGLMFGVDWRSDEPPTVAAELWSATPRAAAPRAVEPPPTPPPPPVKRVEPVVAPKPPEPVAVPAPTPALPDPQIAIEKARRAQAQRVAAEQEAAERQKRERDALAQKKADKEKAERAKAEQAKAEQAKNEQAKNDKAEAQRLAAIRDQQMKRIAGMAGATGGPTDSGTAQHSAGPSASYAGRVVARIKPNILFTDTIDGNPQAVVQVRLAPDGTIIGKRLVQSSGVKAWDDAVLRAIDRTEILPLDNGHAPSPFEIGFKPHD